MLQLVRGHRIESFLLPVLLHFNYFDFTDQSEDNELQLVIVSHKHGSRWLDGLLRYHSCLFLLVLVLLANILLYDLAD